MTTSDGDFADFDPKKLSTEQFRQLLSAAEAESGALDLRAVNSEVFSRLINRASKEQIAAVLESDVRPKVLDEVFQRMEDHFRPDKAGTTTAVIHWRIQNPQGDDDQYESVISNGTCHTNKPPKEEPRVTMTLSGPEFLKLVSGNGSPVMMFMTGKVKIKGDLGLAASLSNLFDIPKA